MKKKRFIDWQNDIFSRDSGLNLIVAEREIGKTFGLREQILRDWFNNGERAVAVVRYKDDMSVVCQDYFGQIAEKTEDVKLRAKLSGVEFSYRGSAVMVRDKAAEGEKQTNKWDELVRIIPLSKATRYKQASMHKLRRVVFDEAIIDRAIDPYTRYLPNEYALLNNLLKTLERYSDKDANGRARLRVYLMGNAVGSVFENPYFQELGFQEAPEFGQRWFMNKLWFFFYPDPADYVKRSKEKGLADKMAAGTIGARGNLDNKFSAPSMDFIGKKSSSAVFAFGIKYSGACYGVWVDFESCAYFIYDGFPKYTEIPIYALTTADNRLNYFVGKRSDPQMQTIAEVYRAGLMRFENAKVQSGFYGVLKLFGIL